MDTETKDPRWLAYTRKHLETMLEHGVDRAGEYPSLMWYANVATPDATPLDGGCSLYYDQPLLAALHRLAELVDEEKFARSADEYVRGFTERCLARTGLPLWGPHYSFDPAQAAVIRQDFKTPPTPSDPDVETGDLHEIRPIPPAWELLWRINPAIAEEAILGAAQLQISDPLTGQCSRHANLATDSADLATGGILTEALAWLVRNVEGDFPMQLARGVADYAFSHRDPTTGLLPRNPAASDDTRTTAGSETGIWAGCLIRAAALADEPSWVGLADEAMKAWLSHAYDEEAAAYHATLHTTTGKPLSDQPSYLNPWDATSGFSLQVAEACFLLYGETEEPEYAEACERWRTLIAASLPTSQEHGATAEQYGRTIHFLQACSEEWPENGYAQLAIDVANEAVLALWAGSMFRTAPGVDACRSSEGIGFLLLAFLYLHSEREPHMMGSGW
jgi:hypothetical protein